MAKVIIFSREFPAYHPEAGQPTYFVEKCIKGFPEFDNPVMDLFSLIPLAIDQFASFKPKLHTIRKGHRFKVGDKFSPRIWSGKPYRSKQIIIAPDIEVKKTWDIEIAIGIEGININGDWIFVEYKTFLKQLATNDGLSVKDFKAWFNTPSFEGQVICWDESVNY